MKIKSFILVSLFAVSAHATKMACFNREQLKNRPLFVEMDSQALEASFTGKKCDATRVEYKPRAARYQGWIRFATDKKNCPEMSEPVFGLTSSSKEPIALYWFSVSPEVQAGQKGFIQIGYQNDWDPGAGAESKIFLSCVVAR